MRLEDMSFTDYLTDEYDLRERQRKERMKQAEFEKYVKEHNIFYCTKNILEQIDADVRNIKDFEVVHGALYVREFEVIKIIDKYMKGE